MTWLGKRRQRWAANALVRAKRADRAKIFASRACVLAFPVLGATLISYGAWMIYPPAGFIVGGVLLVLLERRVETELVGGDE